MLGRGGSAFDMDSHVVDQLNERAWLQEIRVLLQEDSALCR